MVLPASHRVPRVPWYSGTLPREGVSFRLRGCHPLWHRFPTISAMKRLCNSPRDPQLPPARPRNPRCTTPAGLAYTWFRLLPFRSPLLWESRLLSFPRGTEMFQFPPLASWPYGFRPGYPGFTRMGCPIQASPGLSSLGSSPELIAAFHAFRRLLVPRHPPYALNSLTTNKSWLLTTMKTVTRFDCQRASA